MWCPKIKKSDRDDTNDGESQKQENDLSEHKEDDIIYEGEDINKNGIDLDHFWPDDLVYFNDKYPQLKEGIIGEASSGQDYCNMESSGG